MDKKNMEQKKTIITDEILSFVLDAIVEEYGENYLKSYPLFEFISKFEKKSEFIFDKNDIATKLIDYIGSNSDGFQYKNISIRKCSSNYHIYVLNKDQKINIFNVRSAFYNTLIPMAIYNSIIIFITYICMEYLGLNFHVVYFISFVFIGLYLCFLYGLKFLIILGTVYIFIKSFFIFLNEQGVIFFPYSMFFDINIFSMTIALVFCIILLFIILDFLLFTIYAFHGLKIFYRGITHDEMLDYITKINRYYQISEYLKRFFLSYITKETKEKGAEVNLLRVFKNKKILSISISFSIFYVAIISCFGLHDYYFEKNNQYCLYIGDNVYISKYHKDNSLVYINTNTYLNAELNGKLIKPIYKYVFGNEKLGGNLIKPIYKYFFGNEIIASKNKYIYETICERNIVNPKEVFQRKLESKKNEKPKI